MLKIEVNGKQYDCIENWEEMSIGQAIDLLPVLYSLPESMQKIYSYAFDKDGAKKQAEVVITDEELIKELPKVYGDIIEKLTNIPRNVIDYITPESRTSFYNEYLLPFVLGLLVTPYNYKEQQLTHFDFEGEKYIFPMYEKDVNGDVRPASNITAIEFTESADLQLAATKIEQGKFNYATHVIAILCRPQGEAYNEKTMLERSEKFKELPMSIFWEVFFCLTQFSSILKSIYPILQVAAKGQIKEVHPLKNTDGTVQ